MKMSLALGLFTSGTCLFFSCTVLASPTTAQPTNYAQFVLSAVDKAAMSNATDKVCLATALRRPDDVNLQVDCNRAMTVRLTARMREANIRTTPRAIPTRLRQFQADQRIWSESYVGGCETKWRAELNPTSNSFNLAVSQCVAEETYRRALWIERHRR